MNNGLEKMWKEAVAAEFRELTKNWRNFGKPRKPSIRLAGILATV
jgi:hypothetical protein